MRALLIQRRASVKGRHRCFLGHDRQRALDFATQSDQEFGEIAVDADALTQQIGPPGRGEMGVKDSPAEAVMGSVIVSHGVM